MGSLKMSMSIISRYRKKLLFELKAKHSIGTINEWIIDNYYMVIEQERALKEYYSSKDYKKLRRKRRKELHSIIYKILDRVDFLVDLDYIFGELNKYQKETSDYFSYMEINYLYNVIRLILIDKLSVLSNKLYFRINTKEKVNELFSDFDVAMRKISNESLNIDNSYYIEQLNYKLKSFGKKSEEAFVKINEFMKENETTLKDVIKKSHDEIAHDNFLISNIFNSFKILDRVEMEFVYKGVSYTESKLLSEKVDVYGNMYENNKQIYRGVVIREAKKRRVSELEYATDIVNMADKENMHIGFFLFKERNVKGRTVLYGGTIILISIIFSIVLAKYFGIWSILFLPIPVSVLVIESMNHLLMYITRNDILNKLKFEDGIPEEHATMVIIPTLVSDIKKVNAMFDNLETYYLSNKTNNLYFALIGDVSSEDESVVPHDNDIVRVGLDRARELNEKYGKEMFFFAYRNRFYNESEEEFLGYERKRGAIEHFNKLILGKLSEEDKKKWFRVQTFDNFDKKIKYIITLDCDTKLVLGTALKLVGTMAHPMNSPVLSEDRKRVVGGYGILQPRISIDVEVTDKSVFSQLFAGLGGLDIYTTAAFDLYQDVFGEGSFVGKGIYDLEVFDTILSGTFPNNLILSHDMIEGSYLKSGFINDLVLYDDYPSSYLKDANRHHRWARGDWQISGWIKNKVRNEKEEKVKNQIDILSKWKLLDNLRRNLVTPSLLFLMFYGVVVDTKHTEYYFILLMLVIFVPLLFYVISKFFYNSKKDRFLKYYLNLIRGILAMVAKSLVVLSVLPYEARLYLDSMARSLYRMFISKKKLLDWIESAQVEKTLNDDLVTYLRGFKFNYVCAIFIVLGAYVFNMAYMIPASILAFIWVFAPFLMHILSKNPEPEKRELSNLEKNEVKEIARDTWRYFYEFLKEENHYLIPDNYQLNRLEKLDMRTSPTNIAFSLTSVVSAYELGFVTLDYAMDMLNNIVKSIEKLEKWNGQLFNWYDTKTLKRLDPSFVSSVDNGNMVSSLYVVNSFVLKHSNKNLSKRIMNLINEHDFTKLYNKDLDLFSVGYDYTEGKLMTYHYSNFASESRLVSYTTIAKGDIPYKHWFCLDKTLTKYKGHKGVASWSGTAFEYFMPIIFMNTYKHTLVDESCHFAFFAQKSFVRQINKKLPWGISESAYNELDDSQNYKYKAFGVPYLKFREDPSYKIVISPYSSLMAISIDENEVFENICRLKEIDMYGEYGFYESYDYEDDTIVKAYYAHHQGMILASLANYLKDNIIREYFHDNKEIASADMLLKEKVQLDIYIDLKMTKYKKNKYQKENYDYGIREYRDIQNINEYSVVSNGFYSVLLNQNGVGFSKYKNLQINRFRKASNDDFGMFFYIRDLKNDRLWTNTYAPMNNKAEKYKVIFASDKIKYVREDFGIVTTTEITVPKDHTAEIRKVTFANESRESINLEVTSYSEVIMCRNEEDIAHRTFNAITIGSEFDRESRSLIFTRTSKTKENTTYYVINKMFSDSKDDSYLEYETSRINFMGRNRDLFNPIAIMGKKKLSNSAGLSLDPIMSMRKKLNIKPGEKKSIYVIVGFGKSREQVLDIVNSYYNENTIEKAFELSAMYNNMVDNYSNIKVEEKRIYNKVLKYIYDNDIFPKQRKELIRNNNLDQSSLWKFGMSGNLPIVMIEIGKIEDASYVEEILKLYEFFKSKTIYLDIVIINNEEKGKESLIVNYVNHLLYRINNLNYFENTLGEVYHISNADISEDEKRLIKMVSILYFNSEEGKTLEEQIDNLYEKRETTKFEYKEIFENKRLPLPKKIEFYNEYGGFINDGKEYYINNVDTPMPWVNVIPGVDFGAIISSNLGGFTYSDNSREYKLTSWSNDITSDASSERILINGISLKPSSVIYGFGYSKFVFVSEDYEVNMLIYVGVDKKVKIYDMNITAKKDIELDIDMLLKIVLGVSEEYTSVYVVSDYDKDSNRVMFENKYGNLMKHNKMYVTSSEEFVRVDLNDDIEKLVGIKLDMKKNETKSINFVIGVFGSEIGNNELEEVNRFWDKKLETIKVNTPEKSFDYVINNWYLYQVYASRLMAKAAFYQVGGAHGFRDQLQDSLGVIYNDPEFTKNIILDHSKHQFREGDVLHWWHEEIKFGSRTTFSDDYLWLVYVTDEYIKITGDRSILDIETSFVEGIKLEEGESEKGINYTHSLDAVSLYEHLKLCIDRSLSRIGDRGLPLMGVGDWNDGMNKVGRKDKGESVFVGFFLYDLLNKMAKISTDMEDLKYASKCETKARELKKNLNLNAWDGSWYLRAFFDNGDSLGSRNNSECQIDVLSQSWSILSNVADSKQKKMIIREVEEQLVDTENKIIKILTPPFKDSKNNPGYIKDYNIGVRENGGQYTHAALWYILSLFNEGYVDKAYEYYQMINPINRTKDKVSVEKYKTEPYVIAADIYSNKFAPGRGGWTWYTGSASWAYKIGIEKILGFDKNGNVLRIEPKVDKSWKKFNIEYKYIDTKYNIEVINDNSLNFGKSVYNVDGKDVSHIELCNDMKEHNVIVKMEG